MAVCNVTVPEVIIIEVVLCSKITKETNIYHQEILLEEKENYYKVIVDETCTHFDIIGPFGGGSCSGDTCKIGLPSDQSWDDGAVPISPDDTIADGVDKINEILKELLPEPPEPLDTLILNLNFVSAYISNQPNLGELIAGQLYDKVTGASSMTANTANSTKFSDADKGKLEFYLQGNKVDEFDLEANFDESEKNGCQSYPPAFSDNGYIEITEVCKYNNFSGYQKGKANVHLSFTVGFISFYLLHRVGNDERKTPTYKLFYDDGNRPNVSLFTFMIDENRATYKYLSGLKYYYYNTGVDISIKAQDVFNKTYIQYPIELWASILSIKNISWNDNDSYGYSNPPNYNDEWNFTTQRFAFDKRTAGEVLVCNARGKDAFGYGDLKTFSLDKTLYNTYDNRATDKHEYFTDEYYRLQEGDYDSVPNNITGQWDSTQLLINGQAQVYVNRLVYPQKNFNDYYPQQNVDYTSFIGEQKYFRAFRDSNIAHNSGSLHLRNITWDDVGNKIDIFLKLPSQTGWLDLSKDFNAALFTGADGDGAMVGHSQSGDILIIDWTSGTFSTANSGWMYIIKLVLKDKNIEITEMWDFGG